jgi:hypothetical protein
MVGARDSIPDETQQSRGTIKAKFQDLSNGRPNTAVVDEKEDGEYAETRWGPSAREEEKDLLVVSKRNVPRAK